MADPSAAEAGAARSGCCQQGHPAHSVPVAAPVWSVVRAPTLFWSSVFSGGMDFSSYALALSLLPALPTGFLF